MTENCEVRTQGYNRIPECTQFSSLQMRSEGKQTEEGRRRRERLYKEAVAHIQFMVEIYRYQMEMGRHFIHEHPLTATSWQLREIRELMADPRVHRVGTDQCMMGLKTWKRGGGEAPAMKPTRFLTTSKKVATELAVQCDGNHEHQQLTDNRAKQAAIYPEKLCRAICMGNRARKRRLAPIHVYRRKSRRISCR